jgi:5-methyltetrahydrofolate--homocysteine methyltransferase
MAGMDEVGRLFNKNELIVAEVLQSAEAMKAAGRPPRAAHGEERVVDQGKDHPRHRSKGDVHDIGKNLVEIILGNNGYRVMNLGIKVPPDELVRAYQAHMPDAIGLSGTAGASRRR